jgi:hypothetical protein
MREICGDPGTPLSAHGSQVGQVNRGRHNAELEELALPSYMECQLLISLRGNASWLVRDFCVPAMKA